MILIKNNVIELKFKQISYMKYMIIQRIFEKINRKINVLIKIIFNRQRQKYRFVNQLIIIKKELKIQYYERVKIIKILKSNILSLSFIYFINDFDLYRNIYRNLIDIYFTISTLTLLKR